MYIVAEPMLCNGDIHMQTTKIYDEFLSKTFTSMIGFVKNCLVKTEPLCLYQQPYLRCHKVS